MRHVMSPLDFSVEEVDRILDLAADIKANPEKYAHACEGKKLATLFYEPSTRTRLSFEAAMLNLGGSVLGFSSADSSSASKGESVADTIRIISCYADICCDAPSERRRSAGSFHVFSYPGHQCRRRRPSASDPDADRSDDHPLPEKGRLDNFTIGLCGDLKFGRTVHSLIKALIRYPNIKFVLISPDELRLPDYIRDDVLVRNHQQFEEVVRLEDALPQLGPSLHDPCSEGAFLQ